MSKLRSSSLLGLLIDQYFDDCTDEEILCYECNKWVDIEEACDEETGQLICTNCGEIIEI